MACGDATRCAAGSWRRALGGTAEPCPEQGGQLTDDDVSRDIRMVEPPVTGRLDHAGDGVRPDERPFGCEAGELGLAGDALREFGTEAADEALHLSAHDRLLDRGTLDEEA